VLDHFEKKSGDDDGGGGGSKDQAAAGSGAGGGGGDADIIPVKKSDMRWLTRSDLEGLPSQAEREAAAAADAGRRAALPELVAEAIRDAAVDVPEVTQVRLGLSCLASARVEEVILGVDTQVNGEEGEWLQAAWLLGNVCDRG
jgi:hypothetical protein